MVLWAGLLTCAASGHGAQSREVQEVRRLWTGAWGGWGSWLDEGLGWTDGDQGWTGTWLDGGLAGQLGLYWPLELMRAQEVRCRAARVHSPQSC